MFKRQYSLVLLYCQQSAAALSVAAAAATCVCRTSLYYCMYYALKYSLCLALFEYGCARHAALPDVAFCFQFIRNRIFHT